MTLRLALVEDHTIVRHLMRDVLMAIEDIDVQAEFGSGEALLESLGNLKADVIVMDIELPGLDGLDTTMELRKRGFLTPVICMTMHLSATMTERAFRSGVNGYAVKHDDYKTLTQGIRAVAGGEKFVSPSIRSLQAQVTPERDLLQKLSSRELQVVSHVASGWTAAEIADFLGISERTVDFHRRSIAQKTGLRRIADITKFALQIGIRADD